VLISPEKLAEEKWKKVLFHNCRQVGLFVVDEAHCVEEWGRDFRPAYDLLGSVRSFAPKAPVCLLTGTCTREIQEYLEQKICLSTNYLTEKQPRQIKYLLISACNKRMPQIGGF